MSGSSKFSVKKLSAFSAVLAIILMSCGESSSSSNANRSKNVKLDAEGKCVIEDSDYESLGESLRALRRTLSDEISKLADPGTPNSDKLQGSELTGSVLDEAVKTAAAADAALLTQYASAKQLLESNFQTDYYETKDVFYSKTQKVCDDLLKSASDTTNENSAVSVLNDAVAKALSDYNNTTDLNAASDAYNSAVGSAVDAYRAATGIDPDPIPSLKNAISSNESPTTSATDQDVYLDISWTGNTAVFQLVVPAGLNRNDYNWTYKDSDISASGFDFVDHQFAINFDFGTRITVGVQKLSTNESWGWKTVEAPEMGTNSQTPDPLHAGLSYWNLDGLQRRAQLDWVAAGGDTASYYVAVQQDGYADTRGGDFSVSGVIASNTINPGCNSGNFDLTRTSDSKIVLSVPFSYPEPVTGTPSCEDGSTAGADDAVPTLGAVSYQASGYRKFGNSFDRSYLASVDLIVPDGVDADGWSIEVSFPRRGSQVDTGARSRMHPGKLAASIDLYPNSGGGDTDHEVGEFSLIRDGEVIETVGFSYDDAASVVIDQLRSTVYISGPFYAPGGIARYQAYNGLNQPLDDSYTVGVNGNCASPICNLSFNNFGWNLGLKQGDSGTVYVLRGEVEVFSSNFEFKSASTFYPYRLVVVVNDDGTLKISVRNSNDGNLVSFDYFNMIGISVGVSGTSACETESTVMTCSGVPRAGQVTLSIARGSNDPEIVDQFAYSLKGQSTPGDGGVSGGSETNTTSVTQVGVLLLSDLPLVQDKVVAQVLGEDQTELSCDEVCIDKILKESNLTGDIYVGSGDGELQKLDSTTKIQLKDLSQLKIEVRPTDGSAAFKSDIVFVGREENGVPGLAVVSSNSKPSVSLWVKFLIGLSVLVLIGLLLRFRGRSKPTK
jgi:hypothetical protein